MKRKVNKTYFDMEKNIRWPKESELLNLQFIDLHIEQFRKDMDDYIELTSGAILNHLNAKGPFMTTGILARMIPIEEGTVKTCKKCKFMGKDGVITLCTNDEMMQESKEPTTAEQIEELKGKRYFGGRAERRRFIRKNKEGVARFRADIEKEFAKSEMDRIKIKIESVKQYKNLKLLAEACNFSEIDTRLYDGDQWLFIKK